MDIESFGRKKRKLCFIILGIGVLATLVLALAPPARAVSGYTTPWRTIYTNRGIATTSSTNAGCYLCHGTSTGFNFNPYGYQIFFDTNIQGKTLDQAITGAEGVNSDNDPGNNTNLQEIMAAAQPGWTPGPHNSLYRRCWDSSAPIRTRDRPSSVISILWRLRSAVTAS